MRITLGGVALVLSGLDAQRAAALGARYAPFASEGEGEGPALRARLGLEDAEYFIPPPDRAEFNPVFLAYDAGSVRYLGYRLAGRFDVPDGDGDVLLARGTYEPELAAIENYVRAAVAWQAASRGGALVHAASSARDGRGYLFYGESGAGKSTLAASDRRGTVLSDDLSLVLPGEDGRLAVVGSPFRGTYAEGEPVRGVYPLAAGFRLVQCERAEVRPVPRARALAELVGNLPFVAEAFPRAPGLFERLTEAFRDVPLAHLHFLREGDAWWDAIERAGL